MNTMQFIADEYGFEIVRHDRELLSVNRFSRGKWKAPGRSAAEGLVKRAVAMTPFALSILRRTYDAWYGEKMHSSFIVMSAGQSGRSMPSLGPQEGNTKIASVAGERS